MLAYEVLRVINSKPLFAIDHYLRMQNSLKSIRPDAKFSEEEFMRYLKDEILLNNIENGNLKIQVEAEPGSPTMKITCQSIPHHYPTENDYKFGVNTVTYLYTRNNPNFKIWDQTLREKTDEIILSERVFEVLYVNSEGYITEGSRSNIFFLNDKDLISALPQDILQGITRKYIIETAQKIGLTLVERNIKWAEIEGFDSVFISGTSPKILPIRQINDISFQVNNFNLFSLMSEFDIFIEEYQKNFEF